MRLPRRFVHQEYPQVIYHPSGWSRGRARQIFPWLTAITICFVGTTASANAPEVVDRIVAIIENEIITLRELEEKAAPYMDQLATIADEKERAERRKDLLLRVLDIEIGEKIVGKELERNRDKLGVTEKDLDRTIEELQRRNSLTREQLQAALYREGITWSEYRKKLRDQLERASLIRFKVQGRVQVKDSDAKRLCRERSENKSLLHCASHILIRVPDGATEEEIQQIKTRASRLEAELAAGGDFAAYALKHSDDTSAPDGNIGCFARGEMVEEFEEAVFSLKVGEISPVVRTDFGFHIIKLRERRQAAKGECTTDEELEPFREDLYQEELERQMNVWIAELRRKAFVEVRL